MPRGVAACGEHRRSDIALQGMQGRGISHPQRRSYTNQRKGDVLSSPELTVANFSWRLLPIRIAAMRIIAIIVITLSAITSALSYDGKLIHPQCTEENGVRHCEVPSEEATPTTPIKPHEQLSPQASQNSDVPQRHTNDIRKLQFPKDLQFHYDNRSVTINFGPYHLYMQAR